MLVDKGLIVVAVKVLVALEKIVADKVARKVKYRLPCMYHALSYAIDML